MSGKGIHLPSPSYWPIVTAFGTALTLVGFLMHVTLWVILAGRRDHHARHLLVGV